MRPPWLVIGLVASVVLNLFLIGAGAGVFALATRMAHESAAVRGRGPGARHARPAGGRPPSPCARCCAAPGAT